jgi:hypothetical protein
LLYISDQPFITAVGFERPHGSSQNPGGLLDKNKTPEACAADLTVEPGINGRLVAFP